METEDLLIHNLTASLLLWVNVGTRYRPADPLRVSDYRFFLLQAHFYALSSVEVGVFRITGSPPPSKYISFISFTTIVDTKRYLDPIWYFESKDNNGPLDTRV